MEETGKTMDDNSSSSKRIRKKVIPWWGYLLLALLSYSLLRFGPAALFGDPAGPFRALAGKAAPIVAIGFLLLAANGLYANDPPQKKSRNDDAPND